MKDLEHIAGLSRQAMHKFRCRERSMDEVKREVVEEITKIRKNHKRMGCRKMYYACRNNVSVGRDLFEEIAIANGFKVRTKRNPQRTTWASKHRVYPNLLEGMVLTGPNQAWQSDIFYMKVEEIDHYGISIIDLYTRMLRALHVSRTLEAKQNVLAFKTAVANCEGAILEGCISHSDRGSQYISLIMERIVLSYGMRLSMCKLPQENAYAERVQGTIKHEYLSGMDITLKNVKRKMAEIMRLYNEERPHRNLGNMTPCAYEQMVNSLPESMRDKMTVYQWTNPILIFSSI